MSVQTIPSPVSLDASDFKHVHNGVLWGLKVRYVPTADGATVLDVVIAEHDGQGWQFKERVMGDSESKLFAMGAVSFVASALIPTVNEWLKKRCAGNPPAPAPDQNIPAVVAELDGLMHGLMVAVGADGMPQVI